MWTGKFWQDAVERAIRTAAQAAIGAIGTTAAVQEIDWKIVGGTVLVSTIISVLMSLGAGAMPDSPDTASFQSDVG